MAEAVPGTLLPVSDIEDAEENPLGFIIGLSRAGVQMAEAVPGTLLPVSDIEAEETP